MIAAFVSIKGVVWRHSVIVVVGRRPQVNALLAIRKEGVLCNPDVAMVVVLTAAWYRTTVWVIRPVAEPIAAIERNGVAADGYVPPAAARSDQTRPAIAQVTDPSPVSANLVIAESTTRYVAA